ncbi:MAG: isochorismatase family protein, partial [Rhodospirillales bacterium]|nr:isochorismatase family protein [Rhodospirillales bacterium]
AAKRLPIYASRDWHPHTHPSFEAHDGPWPAHCVQDTPGAAFHPDLRLPDTAVVVTKGTRFDEDQLSAFHHTGLAADMRRRGIRRVWLGGLALDACIEATALDARREGLAVQMIPGATRPIDAEDGRQAIARMRAAGVVIEDD